MVNNLIYGAIGFLLGGLLGGAVVGRVLGKDYQKRIDELDERTKLLLDENEKLRNGILEEKEERLNKEEKRLDKKVEDLRKKYDTVFTKTENPVDEDDAEDDDYIFSGIDDTIPEIGGESDGNEKTIKMVSEQFFNEEINFKDCESLTYYQMDDMLVDGANDIVFDEEKVVGPDTMDYLLDTKNDYVYVMNEFYDKLYEITVEHDLTYGRDVATVTI